MWAPPRTWLLAGWLQVRDLEAEAAVLKNRTDGAPVGGDAGEAHAAEVHMCTRACVCHCPGLWGSSSVLSGPGCSGFNVRRCCRGRHQHQGAGMRFLISCTLVHVPTGSVQAKQDDEGVAGEDGEDVEAMLEREAVIASDALDRAESAEGQVLALQQQLVGTPPSPPGAASRALSF